MKITINLIIALYALITIDLLSKIMLLFEEAIKHGAINVTYYHAEQGHDVSLRTVEAGRHA